MSYATIYAIRQNGDVEELSEVRNAMAGALLIWLKLSEKYGMAYSLFLSSTGEVPIWKAFGTGKLTPAENIALGFTFDGVWIRRGNLTRLADALEQVYHQIDPEGAATPTLLGIAEVLRVASSDESIRGCCFRQTSVCANPWVVREGDEERVFNFDRDTVNADGREPWELFEDIAARCEKK